jgi:hypothetical protein
MASQQPRDELRAELLRRGLPRTYIARLIAELDDHFTDLLEERKTTMGAARKLQLDPQDAQQRLGEPTQLAIFAAEQYHARSFWGRHPWLTYLVAPLPLLVACWISFALAMWAILSGINLVGTHAFGWTEESFNPADYLWLQAILVALMCWYAIVFPPLSAAWLLCRTCRRNALHWHWPVLGCTLLAIVAGLFNTSYRLSTEPGNGQLMAGFDISTSPSWLLLKFLPKFALALAIGLLLVKREQQRLAVEA